jgi:5'-methylthioadenosine phosphorylase
VIHQYGEAHGVEMKTVLGIIGGSGIYDLPGLSNSEWRRIESPWGEPSDAVLFAEGDGLPLRFLPRHGRGHRLGPGEVNYRANIDVLKRAGVTDLISVSACGSLQEAIAPGDFVLVDQFVDRTTGRPGSFFGDGVVAHVSLADPVSPGLAARIAHAAAAEAIALHIGGTYVSIDGPQFSTRAESRLYQSWGCDVIGMTNMPEARLAREAELCYATVAMVTDYDCWRPGDVDVPAMLAVMRANIERIQMLLRRVIADLPRDHEPCPIGSDRALEFAIVTTMERRNPALLGKLDAIAGRVLSEPA